MKKLTKLIAIFVFVVALSQFAAGSKSYAEEVRPLDSFCEEVGGTGDICALDAQDKAESDTDLLSEDGIVKRTFDLISWLTGLLAGIFIIVGAFKIMTSGGNKDSVKSARNTIIYAAVGLAVIILGKLIINVVIGLSNQANG